MPAAPPPPPLKLKKYKKTPKSLKFFAYYEVLTAKFNLRMVPLKSTPELQLSFLQTLANPKCYHHIKYSPESPLQNILPHKRPSYHDTPKASPYTMLSPPSTRSHRLAPSQAPCIPHHTMLSTVILRV